MKIKYLLYVLYVTKIQAVVIDGLTGNSSNTSPIVFNV